MSRLHPLDEQLRAAEIRRAREIRELKAEIAKGAGFGALLILAVLVGYCLAP